MPLMKRSEIVEANILQPFATGRFWEIHTKKLFENEILLLGK